MPPPPPPVLVNLAKTIRFILATESYGGHYGPGFASYFESQNALIKSGKLTGEIINLGALMVNK